MDSSEIFKQYVSRTCAGCDKAKRTHQAFCSFCYRELPAALRKCLWKRFGEGFEEAYQACLSWFRLHPIADSPQRCSE